MKKSAVIIVPVLVLGALSLTGIAMMCAQSFVEYWSASQEQTEAKQACTDLARPSLLGTIDAFGPPSRLVSQHGRMAIDTYVGLDMLTGSIILTYNLGNFDCNIHFWRSAAGGESIVRTWVSRHQESETASEPVDENDPNR